MVKSWRRGPLLLAVLAGAALVCGGWAWWTDRRYKSEMEEIEADVLARRYAVASRKLGHLLSWKADSNGGLAYLLGSCELARGRNKAAAEAWARVAAGSAFSERAIRGRMRLLLDSGQLAAAERLVVDAADRPGSDRTAVLTLLVPTFREQGRLEEAEHVIEARWEYLNSKGEGALEPAIKLVRLHVEVSERPISLENTRAVLDQAARLAHDEDDRVWLGRANLAIRTGAYEDAAQWLAACHRSRPEDVAVWRARLRWAGATGRVEVVKEALSHISVAGLNAAERHRWNAWLARRRQDEAVEHEQLALLVAADPGDVSALDRLAELANKAGRLDRAAELLGRKADVERMRARYLKLHDRRQPIRNAAELARLAEQLGRSFEARGFRAIADAAR
jgi:tetratricopeptide (TPR) repeat protein